MQVDPTARCPHRASGWTLAQCTCRSSTCIAKTSYKTAEAFPWPARGPFLREDACACHALKARSFASVAILRVSVTRIAVCRLLVSALRAARPNRTTARRGRWACAWRGGTAPGYGSQVRLSGTALRYSYASHQRCLSGVSVIRPRALFPRPHRRTFRTHTDAHSKPIPTPTPAPSTHIPSCTLAFNFKHLP